jgi:hypothetical protein
MTDLLDDDFETAVPCLAEQAESVPRASGATFVGMITGAA